MGIPFTVMTADIDEYSIGAEPGKVDFEKCQ